MKWKLLAAVSLFGALMSSASNAQTEADNQDSEPAIFVVTAEERKDPVSVVGAFASAIYQGDYDQLQLLSNTFMGNDVASLRKGDAPFFNESRDFSFLSHCWEKGIVKLNVDYVDTLRAHGQLDVCIIDFGEHNEPVTLQMELIQDGDIWSVAGLKSSTPSERQATEERRKEIAAAAVDDDPVDTAVDYLVAIKAKEFVVASRLATNFHSDHLLYIARDLEESSYWFNLESDGLFECAERADPEQFTVEPGPSPKNVTITACENVGTFKRDLSLEMYYEHNGWRVGGTSNW